MTSVGEERVVFFCYILLVILLFLFRGVTSTSGCLGKAASFYCGTPLAFNISILLIA